METLTKKSAISLKKTRNVAEIKNTNTQKREKTTEKPINAVSLLSLYRKRSKYQRAPGNDKLLIMFFCETETLSRPFV